MRVLFSIKPHYADKILNGEKTFEFRRVIFKNNNVKKVIIYSTRPIGKVVGEFEIDGILKDDPRKLWLSTRNFSGIDPFFFDQYFNGCTSGYAICIKNPIRYKEPVDLRTFFPSGKPPQSFQYLEPIPTIRDL